MPDIYPFTVDVSGDPDEAAGAVADWLDGLIPPPAEPVGEATGVLLEERELQSRWPKGDPRGGQFAPGSSYAAGVSGRAAAAVAGRGEGMPHTGQLGAGADAAGRLAGDVHRRAVKTEPKITKDLTRIAQNNGSEMAGLGARLKTRASLERKIRADAANKKISQQQAANEIGDSVRYTYIVGGKNAPAQAKAIQADLEAAGYSVARRPDGTPIYKNYYRDPDPSGYRGINSNFTSPSGTRIEIQFHTRETYAKKEGDHPLYDEMRTTTDPSRRSQLMQTMRQTWAQVPYPAGLALLTP